MSQITVTDPDAGQTQTATVSFTAANGVFSGLGLPKMTGDLLVYTVTGTAGAVQSYLQGAVFRPTENLVTPGQTVSTTFTVADKDSAGRRRQPQRRRP